MGRGFFYLVRAGLTTGVDIKIVNSAMFNHAGYSHNARKVQRLDNKRYGRSLPRVLPDGLQLGLRLGEGLDLEFGTWTTQFARVAYPVGKGGRIATCRCGIEAAELTTVRTTNSAALLISKPSAAPPRVERQQTDGWQWRAAA